MGFTSAFKGLSEVSLFGRTAIMYIVHYVTNSFCRSMPKVVTSAYAVNCLFILFFPISFIIISIFLLPVMHRKIQGKITQTGLITRLGFLGRLQFVY